MPVRVAAMRLGVENDDLGGELTLGSIARAHFDALARKQFADTRAAQGFHVHENVGRIGIPRHEAIPLAAVEPFYRRFERRTVGLRNIALATDFGCRRRGAVVELQNPESLVTLRTLHSLAHDPCAFLRELEARLPDAGLVQQNVALNAVRRFDESVAFDGIKPFDTTGYLNDRFTVGR